VAGRLAMLGFALAVAGFRVSGKNVWDSSRRRRVRAAHRMPLSMTAGRDLSVHS